MNKVYSAANKLRKLQIELQIVQIEKGDANRKVFYVNRGHKSANRQPISANRTVKFANRNSLCE